MTANILSIGDELLIGQTLNTNANWMAKQLTDIGITVGHIITLSDEETDIVKTLDHSMGEADLILITGGLGPTNDDLTRDVLTKYFGAKLVWNEKIKEALEKIFVYRGRTMTDEVLDLARVPDNATIFYNKMGTAPGTLFQKEGSTVVSMPGVPYEMKAMMENDVIPWVKENCELPVIVNEHILTAGKGESQLAQKIAEVEKNLPADVKLAYLPDIGKVKLRLTAKGGNETVLKKSIEEAKSKILKEIGHYVYGFNNDTLEGSIGATLNKLKLKLGTAESCTGGNIAKIITSVSGSSVYFNGSIVSYSNEAKMNLLGVSENTLEKHGAVSEETVQEMISGALKQLNVDVAIAVSGVAGPTGGSKEKPVGTVYVGVGSKDNQFVKRFQFTKDRGKNVEITTVVALVMLRKFLSDAFAQEP